MTCDTRREIKILSKCQLPSPYDLKKKVFKIGKKNITD